MMTRPLSFPTLILLVTQSLLPAAEQTGVSVGLSKEIRVQTEAYRIYQPMQSADLADWAPAGPWMWGDGTEQALSIPLQAEAAYTRVDSHPVANLEAGLESLRASLGVPALAAVVIQDGRISGAGAVGNRRHATDAPVTLADKWHHGSLTKSMTATVAAMAVEQGLIEWQTTLGSVFPQKAAAMAAGWAGVTLSQLLSNTAGAPGDLNSSGIWNKLWDFEGLPRDGRLLLLDEVTALPLRFSPGSSYEYSNAGFAIGGLMLETVLGKPWEQLMDEWLFVSLGMASAGFGPPATPRQLDHPLGHSGSTVNPVVWNSGRSADNPTAIGPAGTVHASIIDFARYVQAHLNGANGETTPPLDPASFSFLHTPVAANGYAMGWFTADRTWAGGTALNHTGSNTQWFTNVWIAPEVDWACLVCMNFGGTNAFAKSDTVVGWLLNNYGP